MTLMRRAAVRRGTSRPRRRPPQMRRPQKVKTGLLAKLWFVIARNDSPGVNRSASG